MSDAMRAGHLEEEKTKKKKEKQKTKAFNG